MAGMSLIRGCRWPTGACLNGGVIAAVSAWFMPNLDLVPSASPSVAWTIEADPRNKLATTIPTPDIIDIFNSPDFELACDAWCVVGQDCGLQLHAGFARGILRYPCNHGRDGSVLGPTGLFQERAAFEEKSAAGSLTAI
jgi:hypothetical protein